MDRNEVAEDMLLGLTTALVRKGVLDATDIAAAAADIEAAGTESAKVAAHLLRLAVVEAASPDQSDWDAQRRRAGMHLVADGGNKPKD
jgi:hypothetical protein